MGRSHIPEKLMSFCNIARQLVVFSHKARSVPMTFSCQPIRFDGKESLSS